MFAITPIACLIRTWVTDDYVPVPGVFFGLLPNNQGGLEAIVRRQGSPVLDSVNPAMVTLQESSPADVD